MRIRVGNIPSSTTENDLVQLFKRFGSVDSTEIVRDASSGRSRGIGFVVMPSAVEGRLAIAGLNFTHYDGLIMGVSEARFSN